MPFCRSEFMFENDVEMYGAQTLQMAFSEAPTFENDVEMYGAQTIYKERVMQVVLEYK